MATYSDPYEEWKQGGRKGPAPGSTPPPAPAQPPAATTPPAPGAPPPPPPPRPSTPPRPSAPPPAPSAAQSSPFGDLSGFKTYADWQRASGQNSNEVQTWYNRQLQPGQGAGGTSVGAGGSSANTSQSVGGVVLPQGATGYNAADPTAFRKMDPKILQSMTPEQRAEWSAQNIDDLSAHGDANRAREQWMAWQKSYDPACPVATPYQAEDGSGCVEKPDNSNKGPQAGAGGAGAGGVGGGGGSSMSASATSTPGGGDMQEWWANMIKDTKSRYTPEAMASLEADQFARARQQEKLQLDASRADQAQRGVRGSAVNNAAGRDIRAKTGAAIMAGHADLQRKKIDADFQDKQAAIQNAQNYVNSMRDYAMRMEGNSIQREQIHAQIRLAEANIRAQKDMLEQQYQNNLATTFATGGMG